MEIDVKCPKCKHEFTEEFDEIGYGFYEDLD